MDNSGNSNKNETDQNGGAAQEYVAGNSTQPRAISESEAMARDIKEGRLSGFVGNSAIFTGELNFIAMARIDGHLTGKVTSEKGTLIIGSDGQVDANVSVATAIISGEVNGDIVAVEHLELKRTAKVVGNIQTPRLIMADGAIIEGNCSMLKARENVGKPNPNSGTSTVSASTNVKSDPLSSGEIKTGSNPSTEKKPFEAVDEDEESSEFTLEVV